jgi:hypothetical protein
MISSTKSKLAICLFSFGLAVSSFGYSVKAENGLNGVTVTTEAPTQQVQPVQTQESQQPVQTGTQQTQGNSNSTTKPSSSNKERVDAIGSMFDNVGVDNESMQKANTYLNPTARVLNTIMAIILGFTSLALFLISALDLLYIAFPPIRSLLNVQGGSTSSGIGIGASSGIGIGASSGIGIGASSGIGIGASAGGSQTSSFRWISDEAVAAVSEAGSGQSSGGWVNSVQKPKTKCVIVSYLKKRSFFLIVFAICCILFSTTVFTDLGIKLGTWLIGVITGASNSIPT